MIRPEMMSSQSWLSNKLFGNRSNGGHKLKLKALSEQSKQLIDFFNSSSKSSDYLSKFQNELINSSKEFIPFVDRKVERKSKTVFSKRSKESRNGDFQSSLDSYSYKSRKKSISEGISKNGKDISKFSRLNISRSSNNGSYSCKRVLQEYRRKKQHSSSISSESLENSRKTESDPEPSRNCLQNSSVSSRSFSDSSSEKKKKHDKPFRINHNSTNKLDAAASHLKNYQSIFQNEPKLNARCEVRLDPNSVFEFQQRMKLKRTNNGTIPKTKLKSKGETKDYQLAYQAQALAILSTSNFNFETSGSLKRATYTDRSSKKSSSVSRRQSSTKPVSKTNFESKRPHHKEFHPVFSNDSLKSRLMNGSLDGNPPGKPTCNNLDKSFSKMPILKSSISLHKDSKQERIKRHFTDSHSLKSDRKKPSHIDKSSTKINEVFSKDLLLGGPLEANSDISRKSVSCAQMTLRPTKRPLCFIFSEVNKEKANKKLKSSCPASDSTSIVATIRHNLTKSPERPRGVCPESPRSNSPTQLKSNCPFSPRSECHKSPRSSSQTHLKSNCFESSMSNCPLSPKSDCPESPRNNSLKQLNSNFSSSPRSDCPESLRNNSLKQLNSNCSSSPKNDCPESPRSNSPTQLKSNCPLSPRSDCPQSSRSNSPTQLKSNCLEIPRNNSLTHLKSNCPSSPRSNCPSSPRSNCPSSPRINCLSSPRINCPSSPRSDCSQSSRSNSPTQLKSNCLEISKNNSLTHLKSNCPSSPRSDCPESPRSNSLMQLKSNCPLGPRSDCPQSSRRNSPTQLKSNCLEIPRNNSLTHLKSNCHSSPRSDCPESPRSNSPMQLKSNCPLSPRNDCPQSSRSNSPTQLKSNCLDIPKNNSLTHLKSNCPLSPRSDCPQSSRSNSPTQLRSNCPYSPRSNCPYSPRSNCPYSPRSNCPYSPRSNSPESPRSNSATQLISNCLENSRNNSLTQIKSKCPESPRSNCLMSTRSNSPQNRQRNSSVSPHRNSSVSPWTNSTVSSRSSSPESPKSSSLKSPRRSPLKSPRRRFLKSPRRNSPKSPRRNSPKSPRRSSPKSPRMSSPESSRSSYPQSLRSNSPLSLRSNSPQSLRSNSPQSLRSNSPQSLRNNSPQSFRSNSPQISRSISLQSSRSNSPGSSRSNSPGSSRSNSPQSSRSYSPQSSKSYSPHSSRSNSPHSSRSNSPHSSRSNSPHSSRSNSLHSSRSNSLHSSRSNSPHSSRSNSPQSPRSISPQEIHHSYNKLKGTKTGNVSTIFNENSDITSFQNTDCYKNVSVSRSFKRKSIMPLNQVNNLYSYKKEIGSSSPQPNENGESLKCISPETPIQGNVNNSIWCTSPVTPLERNTGNDYFRCLLPATPPEVTTSNDSFGSLSQETPIQQTTSKCSFRGQTRRPESYKPFASESSVSQSSIDDSTNLIQGKVSTSLSCSKEPPNKSIQLPIKENSNIITPLNVLLESHTKDKDRLNCLTKAHQNLLPNTSDNLRSQNLNTGAPYNSTRCLTTKTNLNVNHHIPAVMSIEKPFQPSENLNYSEIALKSQCHDSLESISSKISTEINSDSCSTKAKCLTPEILQNSDLQVPINSDTEMPKSVVQPNLDNKITDYFSSESNFTLNSCKRMSPKQIHENSDAEYSKEVLNRNSIKKSISIKIPIKETVGFDPNRSISFTSFLQKLKTHEKTPPETILHENCSRSTTPVNRSTSASLDAPFHKNIDFNCSKSVLPETTISTSLKLHSSRSLSTVNAVLEGNSTEARSKSCIISLPLNSDLSCTTSKSPDTLTQGYHSVHSLEDTSLLGTVQQNSNSKSISSLGSLQENFNCNYKQNQFSKTSIPKYPNLDSSKFHNQVNANLNHSRSMSPETLFLETNSRYTSPITDFQEINIKQFKNVSPVSPKIPNLWNSCMKYSINSGTENFTEFKPVLRDCRSVSPISNLAGDSIQSKCSLKRSKSLSSFHNRKKSEVIDFSGSMAAPEIENKKKSESFKCTVYNNNIEDSDIFLPKERFPDILSLDSSVVKAVLSKDPNVTSSIETSYTVRGHEKYGKISLASEAKENELDNSEKELNGFHSHVEKELDKNVNLNAEDLALKIKERDSKRDIEINCKALSSQIIESNENSSLICNDSPPDHKIKNHKQSDSCKSPSCKTKEDLLLKTSTDEKRNKVPFQVVKETVSPPTQIQINVEDSRDIIKYISSTETKDSSTSSYKSSDRESFLLTEESAYKYDKETMDNSSSTENNSGDRSQNLNKDFYDVSIQGTVIRRREVSDLCKFESEINVQVSEASNDLNFGSASTQNDIRSNSHGHNKSNLNCHSAAITMSVNSNTTKELTDLEFNLADDNKAEDDNAEGYLSHPNSLTSRNSPEEAPLSPNYLDESKDSGICELKDNYEVNDKETNKVEDSQKQLITNFPPRRFKHVDFKRSESSHVQSSENYEPLTKKRRLLEATDYNDNHPDFGLKNISSKESSLKACKENENLKTTHNDSTRVARFVSKPQNLAKNGSHSVSSDNSLLPINLMVEKTTLQLERIDSNSPQLNFEETLKETQSNRYPSNEVTNVVVSEAQTQTSLSKSCITTCESSTNEKVSNQCASQDILAEACLAVGLDEEEVRNFSEGEDNISSSLGKALSNEFRGPVLLSTDKHRSLRDHLPPHYINPEEYNRYLMSLRSKDSNYPPNYSSMIQQNVPPFYEKCAPQSDCRPLRESVSSQYSFHDPRLNPSAQIRPPEDSFMKPRSYYPNYPYNDSYFYNYRLCHPNSAPPYQSSYKLPNGPPRSYFDKHPYFKYPSNNPSRHLHSTPQSTKVSHPIGYAQSQVPYHPQIRTVRLPRGSPNLLPPLQSPEFPQLVRPPISSAVRRMSHPAPHSNNSNALDNTFPSSEQRHKLMSSQSLNLDSRNNPPEYSLEHRVQNPASLRKKVNETRPCQHFSLPFQYKGMNPYPYHQQTPRASTHYPSQYINRPDPSVKKVQNSMIPSKSNSIDYSSINNIIGSNKCSSKQREPSNVRNSKLPCTEGPYGIQKIKQFESAYPNTQWQSQPEIQQPKQKTQSKSNFGPKQVSHNAEMTYESSSSYNAILSQPAQRMYDKTLKGRETMSLHQYPIQNMPRSISQQVNADTNYYHPAGYQKTISNIKNSAPMTDNFDNRQLHKAQSYQHARMVSHPHPSVIVNPGGPAKFPNPPRSTAREVPNTLCHSYPVTNQSKSYPAYSNIPTTASSSSELLNLPSCRYQKRMNETSNSSAVQHREPIRPNFIPRTLPTCQLMSPPSESVMSIANAQQTHVPTSEPSYLTPAVNERAYSYHSPSCPPEQVPLYDPKYYNRSHSGNAYNSYGNHSEVVSEDIAASQSNDLSIGPFILNRGFATYSMYDTEEGMMIFKQKLLPVIDHLLSIPEAANLRPYRDNPDELLGHLVQLWGGIGTNSKLGEPYARMKENFLSVVKFLFEHHLLVAWGWDKAAPEKILDELLKPSVIDNQDALGSRMVCNRLDFSKFHRKLQAAKAHKDVPEEGLYPTVDMLDCLLSPQDSSELTASIPTHKYDFDLCLGEDKGLNCLDVYDETSKTSCIFATSSASTSSSTVISERAKVSRKTESTTISSCSLSKPENEQSQRPLPNSKGLELVPISAAFKKGSEDPFLSTKKSCILQQIPIQKSSSSHPPVSNEEKTTSSPFMSSPTSVSYSTNDAECLTSMSIDDVFDKITNVSIFKVDKAVAEVREPPSSVPLLSESLDLTTKNHFEGQEIFDTCSIGETISTDDILEGEKDSFKVSTSAAEVSNTIRNHAETLGADKQMIDTDSPFCNADLIANNRNGRQPNFDWDSLATHLVQYKKEHLKKLQKPTSNKSKFSTSGGCLLLPSEKGKLKSGGNVSSEPSYFPDIEDERRISSLQVDSSEELVGQSSSSGVSKDSSLNIAKSDVYKCEKKLISSRNGSHKNIKRFSKTELKRKSRKFDLEPTRNYNEIFQNYVEKKVLAEKAANQ